VYFIAAESSTDVYLLKQHAFDDDVYSNVLQQKVIEHIDLDFVKTSSSPVHHTLVNYSQSRSRGGSLATLSSDMKCLCLGVVTIKRFWQTICAVEVYDVDRRWLTGD
jgi:hypothetical protein